MNNFSLVSVYESDNLIIITNSKIDVTFGRFENYYAQNFTMFTINNSSLTLNKTIFSNFTSVLIYSAIGSIEIDNCNFNNVFLSFSESMTMPSSLKIKFPNYDKVSIKFYKNQNIKLYQGDLFNKYHNVRVYKFNRRLLIPK